MSALPFDDLVEFLRTDNPLLQQLIDALPMPIFYKDVEGIYLGCNRYFEDYIKLPREHLLGCSVYELFDKELAAVYDKADQELFNNPGVQNYESRVIADDGSELFVKFHKSSFCDREGKVAGLIGAIFDITEQKKLEQSLQRLASYDELTGLINRREGERRAKALASIRDRSGTRFCMLVIDVDYFKAINDNHGHPVGDLALCHVARLLEECSRASDIVVRYGGEEFVILLPSTELEEGKHIAERYRNLIATTPLVLEGGSEIRMTVSIGLAECAERTLMQLISEADSALYRAKGQGRNRVELA